MTDVPLENGFILLSRKLLDNEIFQNEKWLKVWIWCLLKANHSSTKVPVRTGRGNSVVTLNRGQFIFGRNSASKILRMPPSTTRNIVYKLATCRFLDINEDSHFSIITIRNYEHYQNPKNYKWTGKRTGKGQAKDTDNNVNNYKEAYISAFHEQFWPTYPKKRDKQKALDAWKKLKPDSLLIEQIISFIEKAKQSKDWKNGNGQFIPYPSTFINGHRWQDEIDIEKDWRNS